MSERIKDMTKGTPWKLIIGFALPLMVGNICQQLYTMVDTAVVGQFVGVEALAAIGAADWMIWLVLGVFWGYTQGFGILIAQLFGAGDHKKLRRGIMLSIILCGVIALITLVASQLMAMPLLKLLNTPENIIEDALTYLRIIFGGLLFSGLYNLTASILRALGDSKTPLYAMLLSSVINIVLDLLFVVPFGWGIGGAALATIIAQLCAGLFCLRAMLKIKFLHFTREDMDFDRATVRELMRLGTPLFFQNTIISLGGMVVQYVINSFGMIMVAGFTATNKLYGILEMAALSYSAAIATYAGQNLGAGKIDRIKKGMHSGNLMAVTTSIVIALFMMLAGRAILSLFISGEPQVVEQVLEVAYKYLFIMSAALPILYLLHMYRSALQGMGDTLIPMISGFAELAMRITAALVLPRLVGNEGIYYAEILAWFAAAVILCIAYYRKMRQFSL